MNINAKQGDKVIVTEVTINYGYDSDKEQANKYLKVGGIYTVQKTDIYDFYTDVFLEEFPNLIFNSVHFEDYSVTETDNLKNLKIVEINPKHILFGDGTKLFSDHVHDCCESHYLHLPSITMDDVDGLLFDLSNDKFFNRVPDFGIELIPTNNHPIRIAGYGSNNGYYSSNLSLVVENNDLGIRKEYNISDCQVVDWN